MVVSTPNKYTKYLTWLLWTPSTTWEPSKLIYRMTPLGGQNRSKLLRIETRKWQCSQSGWKQIESMGWDPMHTSWPPSQTRTEQETQIHNKLKTKDEYVKCFNINCCKRKNYINLFNYFLKSQIHLLPP